MRLPEHKIKEAVLHPSKENRLRAVEYFARSFSTDPAIMPLVIKALETHGKKDAHQLVGLARDLQQSEDTIAWAVNELNDPQTDEYEDYASNLSVVLLDADPAFLLPREAAILEARHFLPDLRAPFTERLRMLSWDEATCWQRLEEFCEESKDTQYTDEVDLGYAHHIVEALARYGKDCEGKIRAILSQKVGDFHNDPMKWMEPLAVRLAGQARLDSTIPLLIARLHKKGDLLEVECQRALTKIGTPSVLQAILEAYPKAGNHFRLFATGPLEYIRSDLAVQIGLQLQRQESDWTIKRFLTRALLSTFAFEGIEAARKMLLGRDLDYDDKQLRDYLVETCFFMGERFPEYEEWLVTGQAEMEERRRRFRELEDDPKGTLLYALETLTGKKTLDAARAKPPAPPPTPLTVPRKPEVKGKIGRNDPCPCGSGKKFKNCCMKKQTGY
jgi:hypothetical protein